MLMLRALYDFLAPARVCAREDIRRACSTCRAARHALNSVLCAMAGAWKTHAETLRVALVAPPTFTTHIERARATTIAISMLRERLVVRALTRTNCYATISNTRCAARATHPRPGVASRV